MEQRIEESESVVVDLRGQKEKAESEIKTLKEQHEAMRLETSNAREELASSNSRLESLKEIVGSESAASELSGEVDVVASVSDVVEVPEEYEKAVESALREATSGLVLRSSDDILKAVSVLKAKELGRTAFISLANGSAAGDRPLPEGAIAKAADLVKAGDEYREMVGRLLGNVIVVKDIEAALAIRGEGITVVTLEGETVEPSGAVIAGQSRGILALKRQIRELEEEIEKRKAAIASLDARMHETQGAIIDNEKALEDAIARTVEAEREISLLKQRVESQKEDIERSGRKLEVITMEREQGEREKEQLDALIREKAESLQKLEDEKARVEKAISDMQNAISQSRAGHEQKRAESVDLRLELNSLNERINALRNESESVRGLKEELGRKGESIRNEISLTGRRITEREEEARKKDETLKDEVVKARELEGRISSERDAMSADSEGLRAKEQGLRALRAEIEAVAHELSELEVQRTENRLRMENLVENIREKYSVEISEVQQEPLAEDDSEQRDEIKEKIEKLGPVSLGSIEEYEELKERYDFLQKQKEDLERSIAELEEAISRINATTRKKLREAYDALKVKFAEVFTVLFGGGKAELVLTDERNILETGIDVIAQPPGKKLQNMTLLSGGEKSLAALALLFASFLIKPTPLCILDEADAALDESNTVKFAQMLKELAKDIQFIVVTHNRVTMESSDYIYGITMEEPGVSKVISLELAEA
jgi:chromosome segregation protein